MIPHIQFATAKANPLTTELPQQHMRQLMRLHREGFDLMWLQFDGVTRYSTLT